MNKRNKSNKDDKVEPMPDVVAKETSLYEHLKNENEVELRRKRKNVVTLWIILGAILSSFALYILIRERWMSTAIRRKEINYWSLPSSEEQSILKDHWSNGVTEFHYDNHHYKVRIGKSSSPFSEIPSFLLGGVTYGLTAHDPFDIKDNKTYNLIANEDLLFDLKLLFPRPLIIDCIFHHGDIDKEGFLVHFNDDLSLSYHPSVNEQHGVSDQDVILVAKGRLYGQAAIYKFYSHVWGVNRQTHFTLMQIVIPTIAEMQSMRTEGLVQSLRIDV